MPMKRLPKIAAANTDRDIAVHAADRLQDRINTVVAAARRANADAGLGANVASTRDPIGMLADVLGRYAMAGTHHAGAG